MKEKIKQAKEWCVNHKLELASIIVIPAAVYAVLTYREHQKEFAYTRGIADGVEQWAKETLERGTSSFDEHEVKTILKHFDN